MSSGRNTHSFSTRGKAEGRRLVSVVVETKASDKEKEQRSREKEKPDSQEKTTSKHVETSDKETRRRGPRKSKEKETRDTSACSTKNPDSGSQNPSSVSKKDRDVPSTSRHCAGADQNDRDLMAETADKMQDEAANTALTRRSRSRQRNERKRNRSSSDSSSSERHFKRRTRKNASHSEDQLASVLQTILDRVKALESDRVRSRSRSPVAPVKKAKKKAHDISPSPRKEDSDDEFVLSEGEYFENASETEPNEVENDEDIVDLLLEGKEAEKRGAPLEKTAICMAKTFFDAEVSAETIKPLREKYPEPSNCENLSAKTVNTEIYKLMTPLDRTRDFTLKSVQANTAAAAVANLRLVDKLTDFCHKKSIHRDLCKELLKPVSDATKLMAKAYADLSIARKSLLVAKISRPYQSLCKKRTFGKSLFSEDLSKEIKVLDDEAKIFKTFGKGYSFTRNDKFERPKNESRRGRGQFRPQNRGNRMFRGRGRGNPYHQQPQKSAQPQ